MTRSVRSSNRAIVAIDRRIAPGFRKGISPSRTNTSASASPSRSHILPYPRTCPPGEPGSAGPP